MLVRPFSRNGRRMKVKIIKLCVIGVAIVPKIESGLVSKRNFFLGLYSISTGLLNCCLAKQIMSKAINRLRFAQNIIVMFKIWVSKLGFKA